VKIALILIGLTAMATTLLPLSRSDAWWVRVFDFPRMQTYVITLATFVVYAIFVFDPGLLSTTFLVALAGCLAYQSYMIYPYTRLASKQVQATVRAQNDSTLGLLFANVLQENRNANELIKIIREADPDVILTVETDQWWKEKLSELGQTYPHTVMQPQDDTYGMILYSRLELIDAEIKFMIEENVPSIHGRVRLRSGLEVEIRCLHPPPPIPTFNDSSTERDVELLIVGKEIKKLDRPAVVFGDLNDVAWSRTNYLFQDISGLLDPRVGRGFYNTFHAKYPFMRFPLDHCFHSNHFRLVDFRRLAYYGSDHFPVYIKLSYEPDAEVEQEELEATVSQQKEAQEKIDEKLAET
jgi:endonuclease/exonuclease/phosphatase (EEP) superfamily protein YafD